MSATRITDEAGKQRLMDSDGLGRLTRVCEVTAGNSRSPSESCGIASYGGTGYLATHTYDVLDNVTQTVQGSQTRSNTYDFLARITSATIIEVNTATALTYAYDPDSNPTSITDPRGTVSFEYDSLHRRTRKKQGTTVVASYSYDGTQANNAVGRLITETDGDFGSGADRTDYTYDPMGRALTANRTVSATTYAIGYSYDLMGNITGLNYPSSAGTRRLVQYGYSAAAELNKVTDGTNPSATFDYVMAASYSSLGTLGELDFGNQMQTILGWGNRAWLTSLLTQKSAAATQLNLSYSYFNNGQIQQITNTLDGLKSEKLTYDDLSRLLTAQRGPDANIQRKYQYDYDRYGNRWGQNVVAGSGYNGQLGFDAPSNRITSPNFSYDTSGNLSANGPASSFTYDSENFTTGAGTATYKYDAEGRRVRKTMGSTVTDYFFTGPQLVAERTGSQWTDYIFFGNQRIAQQSGSAASTAVYLHGDHLGSVRVCTDSNGNPNGTCDYEPFGEVQPGSTCSVPTNFRFAGAQWDAESGLYHFWFRQYDPNQARWMSVDPVPGKIAEPQSQDRFVYVQDDPENSIDPMGLDTFRITIRCKQYLDEATGEHWECWIIEIERISREGRFLRGLLERAERLISKAVSKVCSAIPDVTTGGGGFDLGLGVTGGLQLGVAANGRSGEASLVLTGTASGGLIADDSYLFGGYVANAPTNSTLNSISFGRAFGAFRTGVSGSPGSRQATYGPSASPITAAAQVSATTTLLTVPYLGYLLNQERAICKAVTGK